MIVEQFLRKSFPVEAVNVTLTNMKEVADWCDGEIREEEASNNPNTSGKFIKVRVHNPLTERQTKAYVGDWVLYAGKGYKVYTDKAFRKSFDEKGVPPVRPLPDGVTATMVDDGEPSLLKNVFSSGKAGSNFGKEGVGGGGHGGNANPGGTKSVGG